MSHLKTPINEKLIELRCLNCDAKLAEVSLQKGKIRIICPKCKTLNQSIVNIEKKPEDRNG